MIAKIAAIALGGSVGAVLRYAVYLLFGRAHEQAFPWHTILVNLVGSFLIGLLWGLFDRIYVSPGVRLFLFIGVLGSFTTFSTFAFETFNLGRGGNITYGLIYVLTTNIFGIGLAAGGYYLSKLF